MQRKYLVIYELLEEPFDEGFKVVVASVIRELKKFVELLVITSKGRDNPELNIVQSPINRAMLNPSLFIKIKAFKPDILIYFPQSSTTFSSFMRVGVLSLFGSQKKIAMVSLLNRDHSKLALRIFSIIRPHILYVLSKDSEMKYRNAGIETRLFRMGVDLNKFKAVADHDTKIRLRQQYGLPLDKYLVLHVGHLRQGRNVTCLGRLRKFPDIVPVIVGSTTTLQETEVKNSLIQQGAIVIDRYVPRIQEVYQASDCYIFPTKDDKNAIEFPLSVLEAMACNLPIAATRFRGLPDALQESDGFKYFETIEEAGEIIQKFRKLPSSNRERVEELSWERVVYNTLVRDIE